MPENGVMIELPVIGEKIYTSPNKGTNVIYEATYKCEPCYCIRHEEGYEALFDYNEKYIRNMKGKITRCGGLVCDKKRTGRNILKFHKEGKEKSISLRLWLFAQYKSINLSAVRRCKIMLKDDSLLEYDIADLRSCNLYDAGGERTDRRGFAKVYECPDNTKKKCITATYTSGENEYTEIFEYSPELSTMLNTSRYCSIALSPDNERLSVSVHYKQEKTGYKFLPLSRFVLLYYRYFNKFRRQRGAIPRFIHRICELNEEYEDKDAAHVNSVKYNGGAENLTWMKKLTNDRMNDFAARFVGEYNFFPIVTEDNEILVEFTSHGRIYLYKCATPEDYLNMQFILMGRSVHTKDFWAMRARTGEKILTPKETYEEIKAQDQQQNQPPSEEMVAEYWAWCEHRDRLLKQYREYPDDFLIWPSLTDEITEEEYLGIVNLIVGDA